MVSSKMKLNDEAFDRKDLRLLEGNPLCRYSNDSDALLSFVVVCQFSVSEIQSLNMDHACLIHFSVTKSF